MTSPTTQSDKQTVKSSSSHMPYESHDINETKATAVPHMLAPPAWAASDDEVSLVDIALVVLKHKVIFFCTAALLLLSGIAVVSLSADIYKYSVVLETGSYVLPDEHGNLGKRTLIESVGHTKSKLETSIIPQVLQKLGVQDGDPQLPEFSVAVPEGANLVEISALAQESKSDLVVSLLGEIAESVSVDHKVKSGDVLEALRQNVELMEVTAAELSAKLADEQRNREVTSLKLDNLKQKRELLVKQVERITQEMGQFQKSRQLYLADQARSKDAMALLLIDGQISESARLRDNLESELFVDLVRERAELTNLLERQTSQITLINAELSRAKDTLGRFTTVIDGNAEPLIETGKNLLPTSMAVDPYREREPIGMSKMVKLVIVGILAVFVALLMTFVAEFIVRVRQADKNVNQ